MNPHANNIERLKKQGAINALSTRIELLIRSLSDGNWEHIKRQDKFIKLTEAIDSAEKQLAEMREVFKALQELDNEQH